MKASTASITRIGPANSFIVAASPAIRPARSHLRRYANASARTVDSAKWLPLI